MQKLEECKNLNWPLLQFYNTMKQCFLCSSYFRPRDSSISPLSASITVSPDGRTGLLIRSRDGLEIT